MNIAICEDESIMVQELQRLIEKYKQSKGVDITLSVYRSGEALLDSKLEQDAVFLDISMDQLDGIQTAKRMREQGFVGMIIFLTSHTERVYEAFEVRAFRYLIKPINDAMVEEVLDLINQEIINREKEYIIITTKQRTTKVAYKEILYIESIGKNVKIHTLNKNYVMREKISEFERMLIDKSFFRVHKSFLVNLEYVKEIVNDCVILENGEIIYVSRLKMKQLKEAFMHTLRRGVNVWD